MTDDIELNDARARLAWRLYFLRAESILAAAPAPTRKELLRDLKDHLHDLMQGGSEPSDERSRLKAALARVGDPEDYLAPLLAIADTSNATSARVRRLAFYFTRAMACLVSTLALTLVLVVGFAVLGASLASLLDSSRFGVFSLGDDKIRIGTTSGLQVGSYQQVLSPLTASLFAMVSGTAIVGVLVAFRMLVLRILALTYSASLRALL